MWLQLHSETRRTRRPLAKQLTTCENTFTLFVLDLAGSANAPIDFSENSGRGPTVDIPFVKTKKQDYLQKYSG